MIVKGTNVDWLSVPCGFKVDLKGNLRHGINKVAFALCQDSWVERLVKLDLSM